MLTYRPPARDASGLDGYLENGAEIECHDYLFTGITSCTLPRKWSRSGPANKKPAKRRVRIG